MQPPLKCCAQILQPCARRGAAVVSVQQNGPRTRPCEQSWVGQGTGRRGSTSCLQQPLLYKRMDEIQFILRGKCVITVHTSLRPANKQKTP